MKKMEKNIIENGFARAGALLLLALALAACFAPRAYAVDADISWYPSNEDVGEFNIETSADLLGLAQLLDGESDTQAQENFRDTTIYLKADIDLTDPLDNINWVPIGGITENISGSGSINGNTNERFEGVFDGCGHTIKFKTSSTATEGLGGNAALFSIIGGDGVVRNLSLDVTIDTQNKTAFAGGVALANFGEITDCVVSADMNVLGPAGGVVGLNAGKVINCSASGQVYNASVTSTTPIPHAGGIAGYNGYSSHVAEIRDSSFDGVISGDFKSFNLQVGLGGIAGINGSSGVASAASIIAGCNASGEILASCNFTIATQFGTSGYCGGIAGINYANINNSDFDGFIRGDTAGGIVGILSNNTGKFQISNCVASADITTEHGQSYTALGGIVGSLQGAHNNQNIENCFASGTISVDLSAGQKATGDVCIGGIAGYATNPIINCVSSVDITATVGNYTSNPPGGVGGIAGTTNSSIQNSLSRGTIDVTVTNGFTSQYNYFVGGLVGRVTAVANFQMDHNVSLSAIRFTDNSNGKAAAGGLVGCFRSAPENKFSNNNWLATNEINTGLYYFAKTGLNSFLENTNAEDETNNNKKVATETDSNPVAALLSPVYDRVGRAGKTFTVKVYPENAGNAGNIAGEWIWNEASIDVTPGTQNQRVATVTPVALGDAILEFQVKSKDEENAGLGDANVLWGSASPKLTAGVFVIEVPTAKSIIVGTQQGTLNEGTPGEVTFSLITTGIENGQKTPSLSGAPTGVTAKDANITITDGAGTLTIITTDQSPSGTHTLKVTIDSIESDQFNLVIGDPVPTDTTAPTLTAGAVNRTSDTAATVKFTSDESGTYYYAVVDSGTQAPTINTTDAGTACDTSEQTITLTALTAGAKDIYIVVKDAAGNTSATTFKIAIPAYTAGGGDTTSPTVTSVSPSGTGVETSGNVVIVFDEPMDETPGAVSLNSSALTGAGGWSNGQKTYTIAYSGLANNTLYTVSISGFEDAAGNAMTAVTSGHTFTTKAAAGGASTEVTWLEGIGTVTLPDGVESNNAAGEVLNELDLPSDLLEFVTVPVFGDEGAPITVDTDKLKESIEGTDLGNNVVDVTGDMLPLPVFEAQVTGKSLTALVTFKVDLSDFAANNKKIGDLIILKLLNDGTTTAPGRVNRLEDVAAEKYIFTNKTGDNVPDGTAISKTNPVYYLSVGVRDESKYDWHTDAAGSEEHKIVDPLTIALRKAAAATASTNTNAKIWTKISGDIVKSADTSGSILLPMGVSVDSLPIWVAPENEKATVKPAASGDKYDFTSPKTFRVTAEDGVTSKDYKVTVLLETDDDETGDLIDASDPAKWETYVIFNSSGSVLVQISVPMNGTVVPTAIAAKTKGFDKTTESFLIIDGDGKSVHDYSRGAGERGAATPYTLIFSAISPSVDDYTESRIYSFTYTVNGVEYTQKFGSGDAGISVYDDTTVEEEEPYVNTDTETEDEENNGKVNTPGDGSGGCDAGALAVMALAIAGFTAAMKKRV
jgi:hypothetical protein